MAEEKREYKDRLFCFIFGSEEHKDWTLSLYNAVNGTNYTDPNLISIETLKQVLYMGMHDDVALLIMNELNLYEHQSSINPNMPLRLMQYTSNLYEKLVTLWNKNKFGSKLISLPVPKLVVFYNGKEEQPDEQVLYLSDSFPEDKRIEADIQVRVRMVNINKGHSPRMINKCKPLEEYAWLVEQIRQYEQKGENLTKAIDQAFRDMPGSFMIKPYLEANRKGVEKMLLTEYDEVKTMELFKQEGREEGLEKGQEQTNISHLQKIMIKLGLTAEKAMDFLDIPTEEQGKYAALLKESKTEFNK